MKLIKLIVIFATLLLTNLSAAVISGYCFEDVNGNGIKDAGEICAEEAVWAKIENLENGHVIVSKNLHSEDPLTSGYFEFDTHSKTGRFRVFLDNNADAKDTVATPPANTHFTVDPEGDGSDTNLTNGETTYTIVNANETYSDQNFGFQFGGDCVCEGADGIIIKKTITIDGNVSDWESVHTDADNNICDHGDEQDKDAIVQSTGRNLVQFTWTGDQIFAYGFTQRVGSSTNTQTFIYYADKDGDGRMETGDFAVVAGWQGNTGTTSLYYYPYIPADPVNGDSMVWTQADIDSGKLAPGGQIPDSSWIGSGDGYTLAGHLDTANSVNLVAAGDGSAQGVTVASGGISDAGVKMEWRVRWSAIGLEPFQGITYHISSMNSSINDNNPPGQVDDNMAGCYGEATLKYCGVTLTGGDSITLPAFSTGPVYFDHNLTNTGNVDDNITLTWSQLSGDFAPASVTFYNDLNGNKVVDSGEPVLISPVAMASGESINLLVEVGLPADLNNSTATLEINATTTACDIQHSAIGIDSINVSALNYDLAIAKTVNGVDAISANEGETVRYTITVINHGPDNATNVVVEDHLPGNVIYDSHTASLGDYNVTTGFWTIGDLNVADGLQTLTIDVNVSQTAGGGTVIQNIAYTSDTNNTDANDMDDANITVVHIPVSDLQISKVTSTPMPHAGEEINYTITVTNLGPDTATNISVGDILPQEISCLDDSGTGLCSGFWAVTDMAVGDVVTVMIQAQVNPGVVGGDLIINTANVSSDVIDPDPSNNASTAVMIVDDHTDLGIEKTVISSTPYEGDTIVYTIVMTNYGPHDVTNVVVQEEPLNGVTFSDANVTVTQGNYTNLTWTVGDLNVSETAMMTIFATVDNNTAGRTIGNNVRIVSLDQNDTNGTNDVAYASIAVQSDCHCDKISSDSASAMNKTVGVLMMLMTVLIGLFFVKREDKYKRNER